MRLRAELMPADIDEDLIPQLLDDLSTVEEDSAPAYELKAAIARLESVSHEVITPERATAILTNYGSEWVRTALHTFQMKPVNDVTWDELVEVLRRACPGSEVDEPRRRAYMAIFDINVPRPDAWALVFYPPESHVGRISRYHPTPEQIVDWIFDPTDISLLK